MDTLQLEPIKCICKQNGYEFWDFSNSPKYLNNNHYFKDGGHLNSKGANEFSKDIAKRIKSIIFSI
jgi:lysophospholipase L1-like esterase